jgi:hypothetical protein
VLEPGPAGLVLKNLASGVGLEQFSAPPGRLVAGEPVPYQSPLEWMTAFHRSLLLLRVANRLTTDRRRAILDSQ